MDTPSQVIENLFTNWNHIDGIVKDIKESRIMSDIQRYSQLVEPPHNLMRSRKGYWCEYSDHEAEREADRERIKDLELEVKADDINTQAAIDQIAEMSQRIAKLIKEIKRLKRARDGYH